MNLPFKYKLALIIVGAAIGVPTSYNGYLWMQGKFVKQQLNCMTDMYQADMTSEASAEAARLQLQSCVHNIDPHKSTVKLLQDEHKRIHH